MPSLTRRRLLGLGGAAALGAFAGCSGDSTTAGPPRVGELDVVNYDPQSYLVHVLLLDGDDPVYWASRQASAATEERLGGAVFEGYPTEPGDYRLHARLDDDPQSEMEQLDFAEYDVDCLGISLAVGDVTEGRTGDLSVWKTTDPQVCTAESTTTE